MSDLGLHGSHSGHMQLTGCFGPVQSAWGKGNGFWERSEMEKDVPLSPRTDGNIGLNRSQLEKTGYGPARNALAGLPDGKAGK